MARKNDIEICWTHNKGKSVITERFVRTLKNKIYKYLTLKKIVYIDKLDNIVYKYNNTYHITIKTKLADVKPSTYIDSSKDVNYKDPKFKIGDIVRISKIKTFLQKAIFQIDLKKFLWLKKLNTLYCGHMLLVILKAKEIVGTFYQRELQKANQKEFIVQKAIKGKGDKLYVKWMERLRLFF